jgi:outer membrane protein OmpA-like peptidoglycan-associated protein
MADMNRRTAILFVLLMLPSFAFAQEPGKDEEGCKPSRLVSRMPGCGIMRCEVKEFDSASIIQNKAEEKEFEGQTEKLVFICPVSQSSLQIIRNGEAALRKAGYSIVFSGKTDGATEPSVVGKKGAQWIQLRAAGWNEFPGYEQTAVLVQAMTQQMTASAQAMSDAIAKSGKLDVYGITFATGQATITPASDVVLNDVLAVLTANADWKLRVEGHTDNVGDKAANLKLSNARAAAVVGWLTSKGIDAARLSAAGLGDTQPVAPNTTEDGRARNRRVVLVKM